MKLFLDTGNVDQIKEIAELGILDGVTTNPSLIAKEGKPFLSTLRKIASIITKENKNAVLNGEVVSIDTKGMLNEAAKLRKLHKNMVIKIPMTQEGIKAVKILSKKKIPTNVTLCFSANQALLAAKAGATYISPFVGRLDDIGHEGMRLVEEIRTVYDNFGFDTQIIVASIRSPDQVKVAALIGADICTIPYKIAKQMFKHALTDLGLEKFLADWKKFQKGQKKKK